MTGFALDRLHRVVTMRGPRSSSRYSQPSAGRPVRGRSRADSAGSSESLKLCAELGQLQPSSGLCGVCCGVRLRFVALQLGADAETIHAYASRQQTVSEHQQRIGQCLRLRAFDAAADERLVRFLEAEALRLDRTASLLARARAWLRDEHVLAPADSVLRRAIGAARHKARALLTQRMAERLSAPMRDRLDALIAVDDDQPHSPLHHIKASSSSPSVGGMKRLLARLELIEATGVLEIDVGWVNGNYQRILFHSVRTASADRVRRMAAPRRHLALVCFLHQAWRDTRSTCTASSSTAIASWSKTASTTCTASSSTVIASGSKTASTTCSRRNATPSTGSFTAVNGSARCCSSRSIPTAAMPSLSDAFDRFLEGASDNRQVAFDDDGWRLKKDPAEHLDAAQSASLAELHRWLDARNRSIRLADLLIEVENDLGFSVHFQQPGEKVDPVEVCALLAAILAHGCNLGLYTMEKVAPDIAYRRLKYVSDWRLVEENQRAALAAIVHGISRLDAASHWGDGTTSASDGQRFAMPHKVLQRTYSTRFNDFALEFYSFVADNYAPFYSRPIECTDRDAPFVLDGVLYHESDLDLEEHYTDTHGYTEINFAAFVMVGMRFCPRIRSLHRQRIYCADPARDHGVLEPVLQRGRRAVNFRLIAQQQWDRIGQFYAAFPAGHATASAALQRLNRFQASNRFYAANRELGRALKTEFVLQYMSEPKLRAKVRRGLLKFEQLHALARAVYYGQRGRISAREVYDQMNACSCLTLILACIVYWQAREISRIAAAPDFPFDPDLLRHVSPIEWKNVILYGEIKIDPAKLKMRGP